MKKLLAILLVALSVLSLCACSTDNGGKSPDPEGKEVLEFGKKDEAKYLVQVDINPSVILGYAEDENVVYIASNNDDGFELLKKHNAEKILGEPINAALGAIMSAAHEDGYEAESFDVQLSSVGEEKADTEKLTQIAYRALETCDFDIKLSVEGEKKIAYSPGNAECELCKGEGMVVCENCEGKGEAIVIVQHEKEVRNDYVCEICGGKGWIDDGMHGGEKGNCDTCGGLEGKMPSADFRKKAFDLVMVDEEEMRRCETCDGSGKVECPNCSSES